MGAWLKGELEALGAECVPFSSFSVLRRPLTALSRVDRVKSVPLGKHTLDGQEIELPPVLLGKYGNDPKKKNILIYVRTALPRGLLLVQH